MENIDLAESKLRGQAEIWRHMFAFADSMALKCAVELKIADIINCHGNGEPMSLSDIATHIASPSSLDIKCLARIMRLLVRNNIFTADEPFSGTETLYGLTKSSKWLLHDSEETLVPSVLFVTHKWLMDPLHHLSQCVKEGGTAFNKAHGSDIWGFASKNPEFNKLVNDGMACTTNIMIRPIVSEYKEGFACIESMVDVGGGTGSTIAEIVKAYPHIKGINFDLPHVVATAPQYRGVEHVGGDMFKAVPHADAVFMKWILHNWGDEDCIKILKNCKKAMPKKTGKIIIVEIVLRPKGKELFDKTGIVFDLFMTAFLSGKERTEVEWKNLLEKGGFCLQKINKISGLPSLIEAYPCDTLKGK